MLLMAMEVDCLMTGLAFVARLAKADRRLTNFCTIRIPETADTSPSPSGLVFVFALGRTCRAMDLECFVRFAFVFLSRG